MNLVRKVLQDRAMLVDVFVILNLAFLTLDVYIAHSVNAFAKRMEWVPVLFSAAAALALTLALVTSRRTGFSGLGFALGGLAIAVGVGGMIFHLESQFFSRLSLESLVYTAPFAAPLAFAGVGFLILLNRMVPSDSLEWGRWVVFFAFAGFVGNFALTLADHAQNGFFQVTEWIGVGGAAVGVAFLAVAIAAPRGRSFLVVVLAVLAGEVVLGLLGFYFHLMAGLHGSSLTMHENFLYGAPIFAPLLFPNLALLGAIGVLDLLTKAEPEVRPR